MNDDDDDDDDDDNDDENDDDDSCGVTGNVKSVLTGMTPGQGC